MVLTFALMSFSLIFWRPPTWSQATSILEQVLGLTQCGSLGIADLGPGVALTTAVCAAIALYDGCGAPGARWAWARLDLTVPRWLQYIRVPILADRAFDGQRRETVRAVPLWDAPRTGFEEIVAAVKIGGDSMRRRHRGVSVS